MADINLAFFCNPRKRRLLDDFRDVAERIAAAHSDIRPSVHATKQRVRTAIALAGLAFRPTLTVEMDPILLGAPLRGLRLRHVANDRTPLKIGELQALEAAGVPVPRWTVVTPETVLDPAEWGEYVVLKPSWGGRGAFVWIHRTGRVRFKPPESYEAGHLGRHFPMIAQRFVYTGRIPESLRVLTYLGRPVLALRYHGRETAPLEHRGGFRSGPGHNIVASAHGAKLALLDDPEAVQLARRVHALFPDIPSLGVDMVRDIETGALFVLETNPEGDSWAFSNRRTRAMARAAEFDLYDQFDALAVIAEASADAARRQAT